MSALVHQARRANPDNMLAKAGFSWVVVDTRTDTVVAAVVEDDERAAKAVAGLFNLRTATQNLAKAVEDEYGKRFCAACEHTKHDGRCSAPVFGTVYGRREVVSTCPCGSEK